MGYQNVKLFTLFSKFLIICYESFVHDTKTRVRKFTYYNISFMWFTLIKRIKVDIKKKEILHPALPFKFQKPRENIKQNPLYLSFYDWFRSLQRQEFIKKFNKGLQESHVRHTQMKYTYLHSKYTLKQFKKLNLTNRKINTTNLVYLKTMNFQLLKTNTQTK